MPRPGFLAQLLPGPDWVAHDRLRAIGAQPLSMLGQGIDAWIDQQAGER